MDKYYRLLLDDYSAAAFTSFSKDYYGTLEQVAGLFETMKQDEELAQRQEYVLGIYDRYIAGESTVSHKVAYREIPFLIPAKVLGMETTVLSNYAWEHTNTWGFPYFLKCDRVASTHVWFSCYGKYSRCVQAHFTNLQCNLSDGEYEPLGRMIWGYPGQIVGTNGNLHNRLFVEEKVFKNKNEALMDRENFAHNPDPQFGEILNDVFGDG